MFNEAKITIDIVLDSPRNQDAYELARDIEFLIGQRLKKYSLNLIENYKVNCEIIGKTLRKE